MRYNPIASMIDLGADKRLIEPLMARSTGCYVGTIGGHSVRLILKHGKAVQVMASKEASEYADAIRTHVGAIKCEVRLLGS
jgi:hypothetical protein